MTESERLSLCAPPLAAWYAGAARDLPWRRTRDPYRVWVSEIMLQQTRVEAVRGYYARFLAAFPTAAALARAPEEQVLKLWEGLGYYSRARALHAAAAQIAAHGFPADHDGLLALPGVGPYTAAAVGSICFSLPTPAVDGNVLRLCSRLLCDSRPVGGADVRRDYTRWLTPAYEQHDPGLLTQSLMELGATVCGPNGPPGCGRCPLAALCLARAAGRAEALPVRAAKKARRAEQKTVFLLRCGDRLAVCRRPKTGLLASLWELPNVPGLLAPQEAAAQAEAWGVKPVSLLEQTARRHIFTHIEWELRGFSFSCACESARFTWADAAALRGRVALPTAFRQFLGPGDFKTEEQQTDE